MKTCANNLAVGAGTFVEARGTREPGHDGTEMIFIEAKVPNSLREGAQRLLGCFTAKHLAFSNEFSVEW